MKKFVIFLTLPILLLCGCNDKFQNTSSTKEIIINAPTDNTVNGYRENPSYIITENNTMPDTIKGEEIVVAPFEESTLKNENYDYCGNKNSKVFHKISCGSLKNTKEENKIQFKTRNDYIANTFKPCGRCNP